jgi:site-specific recombinase XerD
MVVTLDASLAGVRDRALLLLGFAGAFRRSELVALDVADLSFTARGVEVTIRRSKTDQEGAGRVVAIPLGSQAETCPVRSLRAWLEAAGIEAGSIFRAVNRWGRVGGRLADRDVACTVKRAAERAGLDPAAFSGHSLRAGLATSAALAGKSDRAIMATTGHKSRAMVDRAELDPPAFQLVCAPFGRPAVLTLLLHARGPLRAFWSWPEGGASLARIGRA